MTVPPPMRSLSNLLVFDESQTRIVPAIIPQAPSEIKAIRQKIVPSKISCEVRCPFVLSVNCGKIAAKKTSVFGLRTPTMYPWRTVFQKEGLPPLRSVIASACSLLCRRASIPRCTKYAAPNHCTPMKKGCERCNTGPSPTATTSEIVNSPSTFPITEAIATVRPQEMALAIVKSTLGPGAQIISVVATKYSQSREGMIKVTRGGYLSRARPSRQFCIDSIGYDSLYRFDRS